MDCIELTATTSMLLMPEPAIIESAKSRFPVSVINSLETPDSFNSSERCVMVSKLASVSAEHPGNAACHVIL